MKLILTNFNSVLFLGSLWALISCDVDLFSNCKQDYEFHGDYHLNIEVVDEDTGITLKGYDLDTVQIYDESLKPMGYYPSRSGQIFFGFLSHTKIQNEPLNTPIDHTYYIYFEEGDYDTLQMTYQIGQDKCDDLILTQWSLS